LLASLPSEGLLGTHFSSFLLETDASSKRMLLASLPLEGLLGTHFSSFLLETDANENS
jgi:hypothetical protein